MTNTIQKEINSTENEGTSSSLNTISNYGYDMYNYISSSKNLEHLAPTAAAMLTKFALKKVGVAGGCTVVTNSIMPYTAPINTMVCNNPIVTNMITDYISNLAFSLSKTRSSSKEQAQKTVTTIKYDDNRVNYEAYRILNEEGYTSFLKYNMYEKISNLSKEAKNAMVNNFGSPMLAYYTAKNIGGSFTTGTINTLGSYLNKYGLDKLVNTELAKLIYGSMGGESYVDSRLSDISSTAYSLANEVVSTWAGGEAFKDSLGTDTLMGRLVNKK